MVNKLLILVAIIASSHGFVGNLGLHRGFWMRQRIPSKMVIIINSFTFIITYLPFQESVDLIDEISNFFSDLFFDPDAEEEGSEKLDELEFEVKESQLPSEIRIEIEVTGREINVTLIISSIT